MKGRTLTLRLQPKEHADLMRLAARDARSMASLIRKWLKDALEADGVEVNGGQN